MGTQAEYDERQRAHEERMARREEEDRPRPRLEMGQIRSIARRVKEGDAAAALDWALVTPQDFLIAEAAERWDRANPTYFCIICHDGKDLPQGYVCQACGTDNPGRYDT